MDFFMQERLVSKMILSFASVVMLVLAVGIADAKETVDINPLEDTNVHRLVVG